MAGFRCRFSAPTHHGMWHSSKTVTPVAKCKPCFGGGKLYGAFGDSWDCIPCNGTGQVHRPRWKVACVNWSHPTAPKAIAYLIGKGGSSVFDKQFRTFAEAIAYADRAARTTKNGDNK